MRNKNHITASLVFFSLLAYPANANYEPLCSRYLSSTDSFGSIKNSIPDQLVVIKGKVSDTTGEPLIGASVMLQGTQTGVITNEKGEFSLSISSQENIILTVSYIGMKTEKIKVTDFSKPIVISLKDNSNMLGEVVATGMQHVKKELITGSVSVITAKDLKDKGITSIDRALDGMIAGLNSTTLSGAPGTRSQIAIRGANSLNGNTEPLWIVDGLPLLEGVPQNNSGNYAATIMQDGIGNILPEDIESITILKDASAAAIYGARAANGVIVITTKKGFRSKTMVSYNGIFSVGLAPRVDLDMMNSTEKLQYEQSIIDHFGINQAFSVGRGSLYYKRMSGEVSVSDYNKEMNRLRNINTNWFHHIFRTAFSQQHGVNLRGGSEELTYYTSINYTDKKGILRTNHYSNAGMLMKIDYRPFKGLILGLDISANIRKNQNHDSAIDPFTYAVFANPYERPYDENGNYDYDLSYLSGNYTHLTPSGYIYDKFNIIKELNETKLTQKGQDLSATFNARYEPVDGLILNLLLRRSNGHTYESHEINAGTYSSWINEKLARIAYPSAMNLPEGYDNGEMQESAGHSSAWTGRAQVDYSFQLCNNHLFSLMGAVDFSSREFNNFRYQSPVYYADFRITGFPTFSGENIDYSKLYNAVRNTFSTNEGQDRTLSYITNLRYSFKDRYVFNFNARLDGADVIGNKNQYTPLWSVGARYNIYKEPFFHSSVISELVLRGSYGYTGQIDRDAYPFAVISIGDIIYKGNRIVSDYQFPNPTVKWSRKRDVNIGFDLGLFNNRLSVSGDYYNNRTEDILTTLYVPSSTGRTEVFANGGIVKNKGTEFSVNVRWIDNSNWIFSTRFNIASNKNTIVRSLHNFSTYEELLSDGRVVMGGIYDLEGKETGGIYGWKTAGINPQSGNPRYYLTERGKEVYADFLRNFDQLSDKEQEYYRNRLPNLTEVPDYVDYPLGENRKRDPWQMPSMQFLGRINPKVIGGFSTYLKYKNFEFTTSWTYKLGHMVPTFNDYQNAPRNISGPYASDLIANGYTSDLAVSSTNRQRKYLNYWQTPGDMTDVRKFVTGYTSDIWSSVYTSDKYEKGDYLRMNDASLSYRFDSRIINKWKLNNLTIGLSFHNMLTFTRSNAIDVATGNPFGYPVSKEIDLRLMVGF